MRDFASFGSFAEHVLEMAAAEAAAEEAALHRATRHLQSAARAKIGSYQPEASPFAAWADLADSTKADRAAQGYPEDKPLLRAGDLRDSIEREVRPGEGEVGSNSPIAEYQELGTQHIPPRSFLGSTGVEEAEEVVKIVGEGVALALAGEQVFRGRIPIKE